MYAALNSRTWPDNLAPGEQLVATARAGFAGLELVLPDNGPLCAGAPIREFAAVRRQAVAAALAGVIEIVGQRRGKL